jgi:hypothetical protein
MTDVYSGLSQDLGFVLFFLATALGFGMLLVIFITGLAVINRRIRFLFLLGKEQEKGVISTGNAIQSDLASWPGKIAG